MQDISSSTHQISPHLEVFALPGAMGESGSTPLDQRLAAAFHEQFNIVENNKQRLRELVHGDGLTSPESLAKFQALRAEDHIRITFVSVATKKVIDIFNTLLKG